MRSALRTVLIVDSIAADRLTYRRLLASEAAYQYTLLEAGDGAQALALCRQSCPDCILIANRLPDMDGLRLLRALTGLLGPHGAAFVMVLAPEEMADARQAIQNGAHDYLRKGALSAEQIQQVIHLTIEKATLQRELDRQREWLRIILTSIGDGVIATDTAGQITFMNGVAETLTGWSATEATGKPLTSVFQIVNEQTRQPVATPVETVLQQGGVVGLANHPLLVARDGRATPIDDRAAPIKDAQGKLLGIVLTFRDCSERRNAEAALQAGEARFRQLADAMPQIVWTATAAGVVEYFNEQWFTFTGLSIEESLADANVAIHPDDRAAAVAAWQAAQPKGVAYEYEMRLRRHDGVYHWFLARCVPEHNAQGRVHRWYGTSTDITERKQAEEQLRYQASLLDNVQEAVISTDTDFHIVSWNRGAEQLYGWSAAEVMGRAVGTFLQTEFLDAQPEVVINDFTTKGRWQGEVIHRNQKGERIPVSNTTVLLRNAEGRPIGAVAVNRDITARRAAEAALRDSAAHFRSLFDSMTQGVVYHDTQGQIIDANSAAERILGLSLPQMQGRVSLDPRWQATRADGSPFPGEEHPAMVALRTGQVVQGVVMGVFHPARNEQRWLLVDAVPQFRPGEERPYQVYALFNDFTERKRAEASLRQTSEQLRLALDAAYLIAFSWEIATDEVHRLYSTYPILPPTAERGPDKFSDVIQAVHAEDRAMFRANVEQALANPTQPYRSEFRLVNVDGTIQWLAEWGRVECDEQGQPRRLVGLSMDITERKAQEAALHQLNAALEARVEERTAALKAANEKLAMANRELEQFTYAAAHDLKSPLRGIQNLAEWLMEDAAPLLPPKSQKHLTLLAGRTHRLEQLLNGLLDYSRIGREHYVHETIDTRGLVEEISELLAPPAGFVITSAPTLPTLITHRVPLATVLRNLISNAIKHHQQPAMGHVAVTARMMGDWVEFSVTDNGPGIAPEFHERIFGMFQTLQSRDLVEGSGIGLALVKKIIENYSGQITVASTVGQGATFRFTWPKVIQV